MNQARIRRLSVRPDGLDRDRCARMPSVDVSDAASQEHDIADADAVGVAAQSSIPIRSRHSRAMPSAFTHASDRLAITPEGRSVS